MAHSGQVGCCGLKISLLAEAMMPYADGETPVLGDYVKNDLEEPGTVTRLRMASNGDDLSTSGGMMAVRTRP